MPSSPVLPPAHGVPYSSGASSSPSSSRSTSGDDETDSVCHEFVWDPRGDRLALRRIAAWLLRYAPIVAIDRDLSSVPIDAFGVDLTGTDGGAGAQAFGSSDSSDVDATHRRPGRHERTRFDSSSESESHGPAFVGGRAVLLADLTGCERLLRQTYGLHGADSLASSSSAASGRIAAETRWAEWSLAEEIVTRLGRHGLTARAAVASTVGAAWAMATSSSASVPIAVIEPGRERDALGPLPIEALRLDPEHAAALREVQVERIDQLLALDRTDLGERFARASTRPATTTISSTASRSSASRRRRSPARLSAQSCDDVLRCIDRACGLIPEPLHGVRIAPACRVVREFDGPTVDHDAIAIVVADLVDQLCARLRQRVRGVRLLRLEAFRPSAPTVVIDMHFGAATRRRGHLWSLLAPRLETLDKGDGIDRLVLSAVRVATLGVTQGRMPECRTAHGVQARLHGGGHGDGHGGGHGEVHGEGALPDARRGSSSVGISAHDGGPMSRAEIERRLARSLSAVECIDTISARFGPMAVRCPAPRGLHTPEHFAALLPAHDLAAIVDAYARVSWASLPTSIRPTIVFPTPEVAFVTPSLTASTAPADTNPNAHASLPAKATITMTWRGETHTIAAVSTDERIDEAWWHARHVELPRERAETARSPLTYVTRVYRRVATARGLWLWLWQPAVAGCRDDIPGSEGAGTSAAMPSAATPVPAALGERWFVHGVWA
ncbi:MAG: hypothetical protein JNM94_02830 [Phycisphaerae bacterium]|nr:hypothetical protein [Phycisphaerae bacterium]